MNDLRKDGERPRKAVGTLELVGSTSLGDAMSKKTTPSDDAPGRPLSRSRVVLLGVLLGGAWGSVMWLIFELAGRESGLRGWGYLAFTLAMMGGGVAAVFGAGSARRGGERISPKVRSGRRGRNR